MQKLVCFALAIALLSACTPFVPVKQDYSKNERLQVDLDATLALRERFRQQLKQTTDPDTKAAIATRIRGLNSDIVSIKVSMGYPWSPTDPIEADGESAANRAQQELDHYSALRAQASAQLSTPAEGNRNDTLADLKAIDQRMAASGRRLNEATGKVAPSDYGTVIDNQGIDQSSVGTTGGAMVGSALGSAAYIDRAFRPGNNYSAVTQLGAGLIGAVLGSQLDHRPVSQYHLRYALRRRDGEIVYSDSIQQDAFRHPVGMCLRIADLQPVSQTLCAP